MTLTVFNDAHSRIFTKHQREVNNYAPSAVNQDHKYSPRSSQCVGAAERDIILS